MTQPNEEDGERKTKVVKSSIVTASSSTALGTLRKQTWKNKSISFKSFLFQSFQLAGQLVSLNVLSLLPNMLLYSSQASLLPVISVAGWFLLLCLCPNPSAISLPIHVYHLFQKLNETSLLQEVWCKQHDSWGWRTWLQCWLFFSLPEWVWASLLNSPNLSLLTYRMNNTQHAVFCMDYTT